MSNTTHSLIHVSKPLVSVIMNGYNCEKYVKQAIDSVLLQTYENLEIIFWDNASTDATSNIVNNYKDKRMHYFRSEINTTLGMARNFAIRESRGQFITFLDTDDFWLPHKLFLQIETMKNNNSIDFIYTNFYYLKQDTKKLKKGLSGKQPIGNVFGSFLKSYPVNLQTVLLKKENLYKLDHLFDERLNLSEEFDLFMRLLYKDKAHYIDDITAIYRIHPDMSSIKKIEGFSGETNLCLTKLLELYPCICDVYKKEINIFKSKIAFWQARACMHHNNKKKARLALRAYLFSDIKFFMLYFSTFSNSIWKLLLKIKDILK